MLPVPMLDEDCLKFGNMEFEESESEWFQMYPGTFQTWELKEKGEDHSVPKYEFKHHLKH